MRTKKLTLVKENELLITVTVFSTDHLNYFLRLIISVNKCKISNLIHTSYIKNKNLLKMNIKITSKTLHSTILYRNLHSCRLDAFLAERYMNVIRRSQQTMI